MHPGTVPLHHVMECLCAISFNLKDRSRLSAVKWGFDPFLEECDRNVTYTHGLGGPCYGWSLSPPIPSVRIKTCLQLSHGSILITPKSCFLPINSGFNWNRYSQK